MRADASRSPTDVNKPRHYPPVWRPWDWSLGNWVLFVLGLVVLMGMTFELDLAGGSVLVVSSRYWWTDSLCFVSTSGVDCGGDSWPFVGRAILMLAVAYVTAIMYGELRRT
jgi:hypothetical protein